MTKTVTVLSGLIRPLVEARLPGWVEPRFFQSKEEAMALAPEAGIGWFDMYDKKDMAAAITAATKMKWLNSIYAGVDGMPLDLLKERGTVVTNGAGINAITIAEYVVMGMLTVAKGYREVVRAQERREWLIESPGKVELYGSKALLLGYVAIGKLIEERLKAFAVDVTVVRRSPGPGTLTPDQWRGRLGDYDWVILAVPATAETDGMIGAAELAAMKPGAVVINNARGSVLDYAALADALRRGHLAGAAADVFPEEPARNGEAFTSPLQGIPNVILTPHIGGSTAEAQARIGQEVARKLVDYSDTGATLGAVNFPQVQLPARPSGARIMHVHRNEPGVLGRINQVFARHGINIAAQFLQTDASVGYVVVDTSSAHLAQGVVEELRDLPGTIRARMLYDRG